MRVALNPHDMLHALFFAELLGEEPEPGERATDLVRRLCSVAKSPCRAMVARVHEVVSVGVAATAPDSDGLIDALRQDYVQQQDPCGEADAEREIAASDLDEWQRHWDCYVRNCPMGASLSLRAFRSAMAMGQTHAKANSEGLELSTVHTMKGAESDIVFLLGLCEGTFPDYRAIKKDRIEEERNSAFVAVTRARRWLYLSYPQLKKMPWGDMKPQAPSVFFTEIERAVTETPVIASR
jgi:DNA helicase-2/ATP-dependent DNA helicase PcrA